MVCFKAREQFHASTERKILCGGHCIKSIYPREKMKSLPGFESHHIYIVEEISFTCKILAHHFIKHRFGIEGGFLGDTLYLA